MVAPGGFDAIIAAASRKYGVPENYIRSVISVESSGNPNAISPKGAGGYMQIMPATYDELARKHGLGPDRFDPVNNITAGTAYMRQLNDMYGGDWHKTLFGYNAGPGTVAQVDAGKRDYKPESKAYVSKVVAGFGQGPMQTRDVAMVPAPQAVNEGANMSSFSFGAPQQQRVGSLTGLLEADDSNNFYEGLGGIWNVGQTESQPPRPQGGVAELPTQTERLDVNDRMNSLLQQLMQSPQQRGPAVSPLQYALGGASSAVGQLAGVTNRRVGIGELLGALGGGMMQGTLAGQKAQQDERNDQFTNVYRAALAQKALQPDRLNLGDRFKVAGKRIFDAATQTWIDDPNAPADQGGPLEGTGYDAQMTNVYLTLSQKAASGQSLSPQETQMLQLSERHLMKPRLVTGPDGVVREVAPSPLPTIGGAGGGAPPPAAAAPAAPPDLLDTQQAPAGAPPPAPAPTVTPSGSRVTEVIPRSAKEVPATMNSAMLGNVSSLRKVEDAITAITETPDATGVAPALLNMLPFDAANRVMPGGTDARAKLADIGSLIIHDRSGAAVSIGEMEKLKPFIPNVGDDDATVQVKLGKLKQELSDILRDQATTFGPEQGYRANPVIEQFQKTGRAPRYEAPMSGAEADPNTARLRSKYGLE